MTLLVFLLLFYTIKIKKIQVRRKPKNVRIFQRQKDNNQKILAGSKKCMLK